jgi:hypothetical protein
MLTVLKVLLDGGARTREAATACRTDCILRENLVKAFVNSMQSVDMSLLVLMVALKLGTHPKYYQTTRQGVTDFSRYAVSPASRAEQASQTFIFYCYIFANPFAHVP